MSNLTQRILTATVLLPVVIATIAWGGAHGVLWLSLVVAIVAGDEFIRMVLGTTASTAVVLRAGFAASTAAVVWVVGGGEADAQGLLAPVLTAATCLLAIMVLCRRSTLADAGRHMAGTLGGLLYIPLLAAVWPNLMRLDGGWRWLIVAMCTAFFSDTAAYFTGRALGRHKLYPEVSPNKTIEGSVGGLFGGVTATVGVGSLWLLPELALGHAIVMGFIGSALGQIGDLVESMLKRTFNVKDSGKILPGHGGFLDRVDALLFVAPWVFYYASLIVAT